MSVTQTETATSDSHSIAGQIILTVVLSIAALVLGGMTAAVVCLAVFLLVRFQIGSESPDKHGIAQFPSSRLGGVVVLGYLVGASLWLYWVNGVVLLSQPQVPAALICLGIFAVGMLEDITGLLQPMTRLLVMAGLVSLLLWFDPVMPMVSTGIGVLDGVLGVSFIAYAFSLLGILFLINAANAADGANGLLAGTAMVALWVLMQVSGLWILIPLWTGLMVFALINIATGKLFLGDSGAYFIGIVLAVALIYTANQQVASAWMLMSLVFYPTADFLVSLFRRICCGGSLMSADNSHFHNMLHNELDGAGWSPMVANSLTGVGVVLIWSLPSLVLFELGVPAVTWVWLYAIYWVVFLGCWAVLASRQDKIELQVRRAR
jgi:UDP-N-acetylmuramyl pentapeptide phosphotransferase/UDP-N-acetylglucosamine-1-phosphate transferase